MADTFIQGPPDSNGKRWRVFSFTNASAELVHQEVVTLADSSGVERGTSTAPLMVKDPVLTASGNITASGTGQAVTLELTGGSANVGVQLTGTWSATVVFETSINGTDWVPAQAGHSSMGQQGTQTTTAGVFGIATTNRRYVRVYASAYTSGTVVVNLRADDTQQHIQILGGSLTGHTVASQPLYVRLGDGTTNLIGQKTMANSLPVAMASDQGALPVSDNASSLTVDAPVATPVFTRLSDGTSALVGQKTAANSLPVTLASDEGALSVDDGGSSLTVDAPVGAPVHTRLSDGTTALQTYTNPSGTPGLSVYPGSQTNESGQITAAQPTAGTPVAGGTVGGVTDMSKVNVVTITVRGHTATGSVIVFEGGDGSGNWWSLPAQNELTNTSVLSYILQANTNASFTLALGGFTRCRLRCTTFVASSNPQILLDPGTLPFEPVVASVPSNPPGAQEVRYTYVGAGSTTEAIGTNLQIKYTAGVAAAGANTMAIAAGKTFRMMYFTVLVRATAATAGGGAATLRYNPSGAAIVTSPPVVSAGGTVTAVIGSSDANNASMGAVGQEFYGGQFVISFISTPATVQFVAVAGGIEY